MKATHSQDPCWFLYCHAVELFLKAFLRAHGISARDLRQEYGHSIRRLARRGQEKRPATRSRTAGGDPADGHFGTTLRYISTGPFTRPRLDALARTCDRFYEATAQLLITQGHRVRRYPRE